MARTSNTMLNKNGESHCKFLLAIYFPYGIVNFHITLSIYFLCDSGKSNRGSVTKLKGEMGREMGGRFKKEGIYVYLWLMHIAV